MIITNESDECECKACKDDDLGHRFDVEQYEYFKQRNKYMKMTDSELLQTLQSFGVSDVVLEVIEIKLADRKI